MPTLELSPQDFKSYRKKDKQHVFYKKSCELAKEIRVHADGLFPEELLRTRRPNEPLNVFEYRKQILVAITKAPFTKVFSSLQKIRRSNDWNIDYGDNEAEFTKITEENRLSEYCEKDFPYFTSVTNWIFNLCLRKYMIDPNGVILVMPLNIVRDTQTLAEPFPIIFESELVIDYKEEDFCLLENPSGAYYYDSAGKLQLGKSFYFVTTERIQRFDQKNGREDYILALDFEHDLTYMPARKLGAVYIDQAAEQFFYESRIAGMIPQLNEAIREYSDLQAAIVLHTYPEKWKFANSECPTCNGKTRIANPAWVDGCANCGTPFITCTSCHGSGVYRNEGPYTEMLIKPNNTIDQQGNLPIPPGGFIEKDVKIIELQIANVENHIYKAFSAINFEFLANIPLNQSGVAKEVDKDELNNTVNSFAEDLVSIMDFVYKAIANYRYGFLYGYDYEKIDEMLPNIAVPVNYDLLGNSNVQAVLESAKTAGVNPVILNALESEYASKIFYSNPEVKESLLLELNLDPLPNISESDKILRLTNKGVDQITYTTSSNIHAFVQRAIEENEKFPELDIAEQKEIIAEYAQEMIDEITIKANIQKQLFNSSQNGLNASDDELITPDDITNDPIINDGINTSNLLPNQSNY